MSSEEIKLYLEYSSSPRAVEPFLQFQWVVFDTLHTLKYLVFIES